MKLVEPWPTNLTTIIPERKKGRTQAFYGIQILASSVSDILCAKNHNSSQLQRISMILIPQESLAIPLASST